MLGFLRARGAPSPEDQLGEVFVQVARDLHGFPGRDDPTAVRRWVFTIARNRLIDAARRERRRGMPEPAAAVVPAPDLPDPALLAGLRQLTEEQREVLALRFVADLPLEEVARLTGRTVGAVKALQHRALEKLRVTVSPEVHRTL